MSSQVNNIIWHVLPRDEKQCVIRWQEKSRQLPPRVRDKSSKLFNFLWTRREGVASAPLPRVNTTSYYRRFNFSGRVEPLGKSRNRCEGPFRVNNPYSFSNPRVVYMTYSKALSHLGNHRQRSRNARKNI